MGKRSHSNHISREKKICHFFGLWVFRFYYAHKHGYSGGGQAGTEYASVDLNLKIQKIEFALVGRTAIVKKGWLYLNYGLYAAGEDSRIISGERVHGFQSNLNSISSGYTRSEFNNVHAHGEGQAGIIAGIGFKKKTKEKNSIFIDVRANYHTLVSGFDPVDIRILDLGLSVGYIFYHSKNKEFDFKSLPVNDY